MKAFDEIIEFFDNVPEMEIPADLQEYLDQYLAEYSDEAGIGKMNDILKGKQDAMGNIDEFVKNNKEILDAYGYYDIFIPAMRRLSPLYNEYYEQMLRANEEFTKKYPLRKVLLVTLRNIVK